VYKLISCWVFIIIVCSLFTGSLSFAQGLDSVPSGWEKAHKDALAKVEAAEKEVMAKAEKESMATASMAKAEEAMAKAEEAMVKTAEAKMEFAAKADVVMAMAEEGKGERCYD